MKVVKGLVEAGALLLAITLLLPAIPSNDGYVHEFNWTHALAIGLFATSRTIRSGRNYWLALPETMGFGVITMIFLMTYNFL